MMARKKHGKAKTPEQIAAEKAARRAADFASVGLDPAAAALTANDGIEIRRKDQKHEHTARRADVFDVLKEGMQPGCYDAARRLEHDMALRRGEGDRGRAMSRVDCEAVSDRTDAMIAAAERIEAVLARVGEVDAFLLTELIEPSPASRLARPGWRDVVAYVTGEEHAMGQGARVRSACANLHLAYERPSRRAA